MDDTATHVEPTPPAEDAAPPAEPTGAEPDPFAEIPSDPLGEGGEELPPGVQPGSLGGDNPSAEEAERAAQAEADAAAEAEADAAAEEPLAEEPMGGEFLEEPPEPDDLAADPPPEPEAAPPVEEPTPEPDPLAATDDTPPAEAATPVEGSGGSPLGGDPLGSDGADVSPPAAEPDAEPEPPAAPPAEDPPLPANPPGDGGETPAAAEPEPEPKPAKRKRKPRKKKAEKGRRGYVVLRLSERTEAVVDGTFYPIWVEAFEREIPIGDDGSEPVTIDTRSGEMALRNAYRKLTENGEATMELVAIPAKLFNPKKVEGKVPDNALTIKVQ
jgi:hypothetical protein